jgi:HK97 family phage major capsid protein
MYAPDRPAFWWHSLKEDSWGRAGTLVDSAFRVTDEGLYAEAVIDEGGVGDLILRAIDSGDAAWSSGTLPHLMKVRSSGYVERWPLVEGSIAPKDAVVSQPRTTTVYHVRAAMPGSENISDVLEDTLALKRSVWFMPPETNGQHAPDQAPPAQNGGENAALLAAMAALTKEVTELKNQPTRSLPAGGEKPFSDSDKVKISVASPYDGVSLLGLVCLDQMRSHNTPRGRLYSRDEKLMRAIVDKAGAVFDKENRQAREEITTSAIRAVDDQVVEDWKKYIPHFDNANLRASEAMQSTLAGSGDELVPTLMNPVAWYAFRLESKVLGLLDTFELPSNPYTWPTISGGPTIRKVNEATDQSQANLGSSNRPATKPTTAAITFNALQEGIGALMLASSVLFDDAGLNVAEVMATQWARNIADAIDYVLLNGSEDATATNIGHYGADPTGTAYDKILILNGLRYIANANSDTADVGSLGIDDLTTLQLLMGPRGRIGTDLANLALIMDPGVYYKLKGLAEFRTFDKAPEGLMTTINGFVANWDGIPVVLSDQMEWMTADTLRIPAAHDIATGVDGGGMVLLHRKMLKVGYARHIQVEQGPVPHTGLYAMSGTVRLDLQSMEAGSVAHGYGIAI